MIANGDLPLVDGDDIDYKDVEIGDQDEQELAQAIDDAIRRASKHRPNHQKEYFRNMVLEYKVVFRIRVGAIRLSMLRPWKSRSKARNALAMCDSARTLRSSRNS